MLVLLTKNICNREGLLYKTKIQEPKKNVDSSKLKKERILRNAQRNLQIVLAGAVQRNRHIVAIFPVAPTVYQVLREIIPQLKRHALRSFLRRGGIGVVCRMLLRTSDNNKVRSIDSLATVVEIALYERHLLAAISLIYC